MWRWSEGRLRRSVWHLGTGTGVAFICSNDRLALHLECTALGLQWRVAHLECTGTGVAVCHFSKFLYFEPCQLAENFLESTLGLLCGGWPFCWSVRALGLLCGRLALLLECTRYGHWGCCGPSAGVHGHWGCCVEGWPFCWSARALGLLCGRLALLLECTGTRVAVWKVGPSAEVY